MRLKGQAYSDRLEEYSYSTLKLISEIMSLPEEIYRQGRDITTNSELSEEEVVRELQKLKKSYLMTTETK